MSRNLYKAGWVVVKESSKEIDSNARMAQKIEEMAYRREPATEEEIAEGFSAGLVVDEVESLFADTEGGDESSVIKAASIPNEEELRAQADAIIAEANEQAQSILSQAMEQANRDAAQIAEDARMQGYQEGMAQVQQEAARLEAEFREKTEQLEIAYQQQLDEMEPAIVDVLTEIYEHIFNVELQQYRQILIQLISSTMRKVEENKNFLVHVAKEDYAFVSMNKKTLQETGGSGKANVEIIEDITLGRNQCMLETENGIFDCGLDTQLSELTRKLRLLSYERKSE